MRLLALLLAFVVFAAACGGDDDSSADATSDSESDSATTVADDAAEDDGDSVAPTITEPAEEEVPEEEIQRGGTLRVAMEADGDGINPVANNFANAAYLMGQSIFDPLIAYDADGEWFPFLAESASPVDGTNSWQIRVREGITYHDGSEMTADDMIAAFEAQLEDPIISLAVAPSFPAENRVERIDDYTVQYNLLRQSAHFPIALTSQLGMIPPA
ncbi:MAG: ABC transporter substrate-binding protein, partial [Acidimicrobiales bacterium]|nr:ABC transporter substrate-binding protein [Acidimicrobiales bacterium]